MTANKSKVITYRLVGQMVWFNIFLLAFITALILYYVFIANRVASNDYKLSTLQNKLVSIQEENSLLSAKKLSFDNMPSLVQFANNSNMVEALNVTHIFEKGSVALNR